ncbi:MAG: aspartyl protease family protein [Nitrososphaerales archaeon]
MSEEAAMAIPFSYVGGHLISIPVRVDETVQSRFILDTGIGLNLISKSLCQKIRCTMTGNSYSGKRMSGQEVSLQLANVSAISAGSYRQENVTANPMFANASYPYDNYTLSTGSPALSVGFVPFNPSQAGRLPGSLNSPNIAPAFPLQLLNPNSGL